MPCPPVSCGLSSRADWFGLLLQRQRPLEHREGCRLSLPLRPLDSTGSATMNSAYENNFGAVKEL